MHLILIPLCLGLASGFNDVVFVERHVCSNIFSKIFYKSHFVMLLLNLLSFDYPKSEVVGAYGSCY